MHRGLIEMGNGTREVTKAGCLCKYQFQTKEQLFVKV